MTYEEACRRIALKELNVENENDLTDDGIEVLKDRLKTVDTPRQRSKWRNGYGRASQMAGRS